MIGVRVILAAISGALREMPENKQAWTYTINGFDNSPYITRTLLPRLGNHRPMIHRIWREDADEYMHNHPWKTAFFMIASGGYTEERLTPSGKIQRRRLDPGDINQLHCGDFHRVTDVDPNTWTVSLIGERVQNWGFLVNGKLMSHQEYFRLKGHISQSESKS